MKGMVTIEVDTSVEVIWPIQVKGYGALEYQYTCGILGSQTVKGMLLVYNNQ